MESEILLSFDPLLIDQRQKRWKKVKYWRDIGQQFKFKQHIW